MSLLKTLWPTPFGVKKGDAASFFVRLIVFIVVCAVVGWLIGLLAGIPVIGVIFSILGWLLEIYGFIGIVLCILRLIGAV